MTPVGAPVEQIARAMQVQVELLKQMHDRQRTLEEAVKDSKRHELVINSTRALNDSFKGLQQVQERLSEQLTETRSGGLNRWRFALLLLALLLLGGVGGVIAFWMREDNAALRTDLRDALDPGKRDAEVKSALDKVESRLNSVETKDRESYRQELTQLRKAIEALTLERDTLRRERDTAREDNGATKAALAALQSTADEVKKKVDGLEKENGRLTAQSVSDQRLVSQLNNLISSLKERPGEAVAAARTDASPKSTPPVEVPDPKTAPVAPVTAPVTPDTNAATTAKPEVPVPAAPKPVAVDAALIENINALLKDHRGSDRYVLAKADSIANGRLQGVSVEVRGADGSLSKVIDSDSLTCTLSRGDLLELQFEGGTVTFHQGINGRPTKSPFFNNRYQIVVLGISGEQWLKANLPFVKTR